MFGKKRKGKVASETHFSGEGGISTVDETAIITERLRSPADTAKLEVLHSLLDVTASEDLDAVWVTLLTELRELGYKLQDEPGALLERLKRQF